MMKLTNRFFGTRALVVALALMAVPALAAEPAKNAKPAAKAATSETNAATPTSATPATSATSATSAIPAAGPAGNVPAGAESATYQWIDRDGNVLKNDWPFKGSWVWMKLNETDTFLRPVYRAYLQLPAKIFVDSFKASDGRVILVQDAADSPFSGGAGNQLIVLDTFSPATTIRVVFRNGRDSPQIERNLVVTNKPSKTAIWLDDVCMEEGVRLAPKVDTTPVGQLYAAVNCTAEANGVKVTLAWSTDVMLKSNTMKKAMKSSNNFSEFFLDRPSDGVTTSMEVGNLEFATNSKRASKSNFFTMSWSPRRQAPPIVYVPSAGLSYVSYSEDPRGIKVTELGLTGKFLVNYRVSPMIDASANAFFTLLPIGLKITPETQKPARFYGINGRVGYRILGDGLKPGKMIAKASAGYYFWGMLVPGNAYGAAFLAGPQVFLSVNGITRQAGRAWSGYLKFAAISDQALSASMSNREIAAGGSFELSNPSARNQIALTLDVSHMYVKFTQSLNAITISTYSLGASYSL